MVLYFCYCKHLSWIMDIVLQTVTDSKSTWNKQNCKIYLLKITTTNSPIFDLAKIYEPIVIPRIHLKRSNDSNSHHYKDSQTTSVKTLQTQHYKLYLIKTLSFMTELSYDEYLTDYGRLSDFSMHSSLHAELKTFKEIQHIAIRFHVSLETESLTGKLRNKSLYSKV